MPLQATSGAASYDGFGGGAAAVPAYIEEVFSTYLYTGNGSTQTITNGIDLSTKGGLVWIKSRAAGNHFLYDTTRGVNNYLKSNSTDAQVTTANSLTAFNTTGFSIGDPLFNDNAVNYVSWTFRKQPKFFDVVTYTGTGSNTTIAHALNAVPGSIIVKRTDSTAAWAVYHRSLANTEYLVLNSTAAKATGATWWNSTTPTSTVFSIGTDASVNASGGTYVAYLFAHDAGGFGLTGTDNVISCGSFTYVSGTLSVNLGYEPQWVMIKQTNGSGSWFINDNMRNWRVDNGSSAGTGTLYAQSSNAEGTGGADWNITSTGFNVTSGTGTFIYIAIRRGPMKVPTLGTSVFQPIARTGTGAVAQITGVGFPPDLAINADRTRTTSANTQVTDRLRGTNVSVFTNRTDGDLTYTNAITAFGSDGETLGTDATQGAVNVSGNTYINWLFGRAPGFFDEVCYTGTGASITLNHNLGVIPEIIITKKRIDNTGSGSAGWIVMSSAYSGGFISGGSTSFGQLQSSAAVNIGAGSFLQSTPTSTTIPLLGTNYAATDAFVAYLFATCPGVSKVGSYTGTATTLQINCGFTGGARFVLIKRTDSTGDWYVWDSARGIVAGNDPYLLLNSTAAEVTSTDYVDTYSAGFEISSTAPAAINASGGTFIFLAIA